MKRADQATITLTIVAGLIWALQIPAQVVTTPIDTEMFIRGDANGDEKIDFDDVMVSLDYLFRRGVPPACKDAADANDDGRINISDPILTIFFLFAGAGPLPPPTGSPGLDPTPDELGCGSGI